MVAIFFALYVLTMQMIDYSLFVLYRSNIYTKFIYLIAISLGSYPTSLPTWGLHISQTRPALRTTIASMQVYQWPWLARHSMSGVYVCLPCCTVCWTWSDWRMRCPHHYHWIDSVLTLIKFHVLTWACSLWSTRCSTPYDCSVCMLTLVMFQVWKWPRSHWGTSCSPNCDCMLTLVMFQVLTWTQSLGDEMLTSLWLQWFHANSS